MRLKKVPGAKERIEKSLYYVSSPEENKGNWRKVFDKDSPIHIEIGMGKGHFIINMAKNNPDINYIGIEMYDSVLIRAVQRLEEEEMIIPNLKLLLYDAGNIANVFEKEIDRIYLNFSDPWPKSKHEKRRLTSEEFLNKYDLIFGNKSKTIIMKTDNNNLFDFSIEMLEKHGYNLSSVTRDLHSLNEPDNVMTEYEEKFSQQGIKINRFRGDM